MKLIETEIPDVKLIEPRRFGDVRGFFSETFNLSGYAELGIDMRAVQDNHSKSAPQGTVRGLHFQKPPRAQAKLVRVTRGAVLDVAVDIRVGSPTFGKHVAAVLSAENWRQMYVPKGFAHGFCTLEPDTEFLYKVDAYYSPEDEDAIRWNDPALGIDWPVDEKNAVLSDKDKVARPLSDLPTVFEYEKE